MARSIWTGVISFGLVSVPVALYSATREHDVSFHQFQEGTADRIRYQRVNERTGDEVDYEDIVRGADVGGGQYVMLSREELASVAPGRSRSLDVHAFVDLTEIDPIYYQKTYYLGPGSDETSKTYALLRDAMAHANRTAIGTLVMRGKEYLAAIRPDRELLVLETMFFADEVRDPRKEINRLPGRAKPRPQELRMAEQLIDSMSTTWNPKDYQDTYTDRVNDLLDAKVGGGEVAVAEKAPTATNVTDLMEVLRRSVEAAKRGRAAPTSGRAGRKAPGRQDRLRVAGRTDRSRTSAGRRGSTASPTGRAKAPARPDPRAMSKSELVALARELDVPGRSGMNREQLERAVIGAGKRSRRAA
ncbi:non-homologous end joining protein Ku [Rugosimonospora acidiphila]|uniref:non-homologous end joining protein Ku n=1 Tax=Rugosimonospora acidiphila TaxID=556531 RepID=UPI0031F01469